VLYVTPAVANLIVQGRGAQIYPCMEAGQEQGMQTLEQDLAQLCVAGRISEEAAVARAKHVGVMRERISFLRRRGIGG